MRTSRIFSAQVADLGAFERCAGWATPGNRLRTTKIRPAQVLLQHRAHLFPRSQENAQVERGAQSRPFRTDRIYSSAQEAPYTPDVLDQADPRFHRLSAQAKPQFAFMRSRTFPQTFSVFLVLVSSNSAPTRRIDTTVRGTGARLAGTTPILLPQAFSPILPVSINPPRSQQLAHWAAKDIPVRIIDECTLRDSTLAISRQGRPLVIGKWPTIAHSVQCLIHHRASRLRRSTLTIGVGRGPDYRDWRWQVPEVDWYGDGRTMSADQAIRAPFGGPQFLRLKDGRLIAYGRVLGPEKGAKRIPLPESRQPAGGDKNDPLRRDEHAIVTLFVFDPERVRLTRLMDFPGYTHYHGVVEHDGKLWIACGRCDSAWEVWLLTAKVPGMKTHHPVS